jgi:hypothetical protein
MEASCLPGKAVPAAKVPDAHRARALRRDDKVRSQPEIDGSALAPFLDAFVEMIVEDLLRHPPESKP